MTYYIAKVENQIKICEQGNINLRYVKKVPVNLSIISITVDYLMVTTND